MPTLTQIFTEVKQNLGQTLNGRIEAAELLAAAGAVTRQDDYTWTVASQTGSGAAYTVAFKLNWACTCPDFQHRAPTVPFAGGVQPTCKHILAAAACWSSGEYTPAPAESAAPLYDLVIATRRAAKFSGTTQSNDGKITWIKKAGHAKITEFRETLRLSSAAVQKRLAGYTLVEQRTTPTEVIHCYNAAGA